MGGEAGGGREHSGFETAPGRETYMHQGQHPGDGEFWSWEGAGGRGGCVR